MKALIIDDDRAAILLLTEALGKRPEITSVATALTLEKGEEIIESESPDIIFLDMAFPDADGAEWLGRTALPKHTKVVFYTCYSRYVHQAMKMRVFDFLLKPFDDTELGIILDRLKLERNGEGEGGGNLPLLRPERRPLAVTTVTNAKVILAPADILYFRYHPDRKLWEVVLISLKRWLLKRQTTAKLLLDSSPDFVRTHKRFIINLNYLAMIQGQDCLFLPPYESLTEVKISKNYRRELFERFYDI